MTCSSKKGEALGRLGGGSILGVGSLNDWTLSDFAEGGAYRLRPMMAKPAFWCTLDGAAGKFGVALRLC